MNKETTAIVLAGDYGYIRYIEATIKSICYHNANVKIYLFNQDIPQEWFIYIRRRMRETGSQLIDVKLIGTGVELGWTLPKNGPHINYMTYARFFIPKFVEEDKVLYLDSDLVVTRSLDELFAKDIEDYYLAAAKIGYGLEERFNAGVLLINNRRWKDEQIMERLLEVVSQEHQNLTEADQSVLNMVIKDRYLLLEDTYNFQIGTDKLLEQFGYKFIFDIPLDPLPAIIHYVSPVKPWLTYSTSRLREVWWRYSQLEWADILYHHSQLTISAEKNLLTIFEFPKLEQIESLVQLLPHCNFHIMAFTDIIPELKRLASYENVKLYPHVMHYTADRWIDNCDMYLDINHGSKFRDILQMLVDRNKPLLTFTATKTDGFEEAVFDTAEEMAEFIMKN